MSSAQELKAAIQEAVHELGFDAWGVVSIPVDLRRDYYRQWIADKKNGTMEWMGKRIDLRLNPEQVLPEAKSIICVGLNYFQENPEVRGRIAKYALGKDYHKVILKKLKVICSLLQGYGGIQKPYVDTGPVMERPIAVQAGLGWQAKNTMVINKKLGNWFFLGTILTTLVIEPDEPAQKSYCGNCTRCITACPTKAINAPYQLDASRCISYLTIEHRGSIPEEFRRAIGDRVFGCDECLDVCPWNRWAKQTHEAKFLLNQKTPDIRQTLSWTEDDFRNHFQGTPVMRTKFKGWLRNACVVLGNIGTQEDLLALKELVCQEDPVIAEHAQWAVQEIERRVED